LFQLVLKDRPETVVSNHITHIGDKNQLGRGGQNSGQQVTNKSSIFDPVEEVIAVPTTTKSLGKFFCFAFCFNPNVSNFMKRITGGPRYLRVRKRGKPPVLVLVISLI
jgi:hypothetical protein